MVEAIVGVGLAALLVMVLTAALGASLKSSRQTKRIQQASALGTEAVEEAKDLAYAALAMVTTDLDPALDPRLKTTCTGLVGGVGVFFVDPDGDGPLKCEKIVSRPTGAIKPHKEVRTVNRLQFTIWRYVTWIDLDDQGGDGDDLKRIVVMVEWAGGEPTNTYRISGTAVDARRGLPAPEFVILPQQQGLKVLRGHKVVFAHGIRNLGVTEPDGYALQMIEGDEAPIRGWTNDTYKIYLDANANRELDDGDTEIIDVDADGLKTTPPVPTDATVDVLVVWTLDETEAPGVESMKFVVSSRLDPGFSKTAEDRLEVVDSPIALALILHNFPPDESTAATPDLPMDETAPTDATLHPYSTDVELTQLGRVIEAEGSGPNETNARRMSNWVLQTPYKTPYTGAATLDIFALPRAGETCAALSVTAYLQDKAALSEPGTPVAPEVAGPFVAAGTACRATLEFQLGFEKTMETGHWIEVKLVSATGIVVAYDTTEFIATLTLQRASVPLKVGS